MTSRFTVEILSKVRIKIRMKGRQRDERIRSTSTLHQSLRKFQRQWLLCHRKQVGRIRANWRWIGAWVSSINRAKIEMFYKSPCERKTGRSKTSFSFSASFSFFWKVNGMLIIIFKDKYILIYVIEILWKTSCITYIYIFTIIKIFFSVYWLRIDIFY